MFYEPSEFPFTKRLEVSYGKIKEEMENLTLGRFKPWYEKDLYTNLWLVYGLYAMGNKLKDNCALCPETVKILEEVPDLTTAGFSALLPGTHIKPHEGFTKMVLRCHLGLSVPEPGTCALKVNGVERSWREGRCLIFDDTMTHEAWNKGEKPRIVLLIDFKNKKRPLPLSKKIEFSVVSRLVGVVYPFLYGTRKEKTSV
ncbi:MAG: aspartyl/asparaginyl beta-hydroxylase domain-containing protein [Candidatus Omnitrophica bacterium]|nr:aspartyl/asparaginyl beta-hydroxylase domain-containing protein [Candidatus Omnitrophota bacterium]